MARQGRPTIMVTNMITATGMVTVTGILTG